MPQSLQKDKEKLRQERKIGKQNEENDSIISSSDSFSGERWDDGVSGSGPKQM